MTNVVGAPGERYTPQLLISYPYPIIYNLRHPPRTRRLYLILFLTRIKIPIINIIVKTNPNCYDTRQGRVGCDSTLSGAVTEVASQSFCQVLRKPLWHTHQVLHTIPSLQVLDYTSAMSCPRKRAFTENFVGPCCIYVKGL